MSFAEAVVSREAELISSVPTQLWIDGHWCDSESGKTFPVTDPSTGEALTSVADATAVDAHRALGAAAAAQGEWRATAPRQRSEILWRAFELILRRVNDLALLMTLEMGKPLSESKSEVLYGAEFLRWFAEEAVRIEGRYTKSPSGKGRILVTKEPIGPVLAVTPWNFPLAMGTRKIGPALAAGCTVIVKPAGETPLSMLSLAKIFDEAGLPSGVLNILTTSKSSAISQTLMTDSRLRKLTFTGSTEVGKKLIELGAQQLLKTSMELGGNAPFIVFDDADLDAAVDGAVLAKMRNNGEACTAANRFYIAKPVVQDFANKLACKLAQMKVGRGTDDGVQVGPLINEKQRASTHELVADAVSRGGTLILGGAPLEGKGTYYPPTVALVTKDARILKEEVFGPVAAVTDFETEAELIAAANDTEYGLAAYIWTRDLDRALRVSEAIEAGMVGINRGVISDAAAPFGGVKASGFGREGGSEGIEEYLEVKYIALP